MVSSLTSRTLISTAHMEPDMYRTCMATGLLILLALTGCNRSSDDCTSAGPGCLCVLDADESPTDDCTDSMTSLGNACSCVEDPAFADAGLGCGGDAECAVGQRCDLASATCVAAEPGPCTGDGDCQGGLICDTARGACVTPAPSGCQGDEDCAGDQICDRASGDCVAPPEPTCADGIQNQDESDVDCGGGCDPCNAGWRCNAVADCVEGAACTDGQCDVPPRIRSQTPRPGAEHVEVDTPIVVEFSDSIDPASVDRLSFIVSVEGESPERPWEAAIAGQYAVDGRTVTFTPDAPLRAVNTRYQVRLCPQGPCPNTLRDREGNPLIDEGTTWSFTTLAVPPGQVFLANDRDTAGRDRVSFGDAQNATVGREEQRWLLWEMRHAGGGLYSFRGANVNLELQVARQPGDTIDAGAGRSDWRNVILSNNGSLFRIVPTGALNDGTPWFAISDEEGRSLELRCPGGFCDPANLQAARGGSGDAWFILR